ncbi:hypothetical protein F4808DRAFT_463310 [Astrocystis sublimbata]|nr:hypothetical protein F4808DRAFT_463310 [Astrocystis sublimbata]
MVERKTMFSMQFDSLPMGDSAVSIDPKTFAETVWAIVYFTYTDRDETQFVRHYRRSSRGLQNGAQQVFESALKSYHVELEYTPSHIAERGHETSLGPLDTADQLINDHFESNFQQLLSKVQIVITEGDDDGCKLPDSSGSQDMTSPCLAISIKPGSITWSLGADESPLSAHAANLVDTLAQVSEMVRQQWTTPLDQMNFLGPKNWDLISTVAPTPCEVGNFVLGDILTRQSQALGTKIAVDAWDGSFTYAELYDHAVRMAAVLIAKGVQPDDRIGLCMEKSKWAVVAIWSILLASCTVVPVDIRNPAKRVETLLSATGARFVIVDTSPAATLVAGAQATPLICHTETFEQVDQARAALTLPKATPTSVAFIVFTSGTTGLAKGVVIEHGPLYTAITQHATVMYLNASSKTFQYASFAFDASIEDIFSTMFVGGCVYLPSETEKLDNLPKALRDSEATRVCLTNTVMSQVQPRDVPKLEVMINIGELLSRENFLRWSPHVKMVSAYGPTECTIYDSFATSSHLSSDYRSIGVSKGLCLWITDPSDPEHVKPVGATGEIIIEGPLLARGYLEDPNLTAQKFIAAPSWLQRFRGKGPDHRCYRSRDLGILNADGTVTYIGRADNQVKIGGQRVELGDIEHNLHMVEPGLGKVAVELMKLPGRGEALVLTAFILQTSQPPSSESNMGVVPLSGESRNLIMAARSKLLQVLPRYMVPAMFITISNIPHAQVGKRDRKMLRDWVASLTAEQIAHYQVRDALAYEAPKSQDEAVLQKLWAQLFQALPMAFGANDNFFEVGGDSVKAIELVALLRGIGKRLTVSDVFRHPEMNEMALQLVDMQDDDDDKVQRPLRPFQLLPANLDVERCIEMAARSCETPPSAVEDIYPAAPMQEALMAISASARRSDTYSHRVVFKLPPSLHVPRFRQAWDTLIAGQAVLRTRLAVLGDVGTAQVVLSSEETWSAATTLRDFEEYDKSNPFTYGAPLNRFAIVGDGDTDAQYFAWSSHHAVADDTGFIQHIKSIDLSESEDFWRDKFPDPVETFPHLPTVDYKPNVEGLQSITVNLDRRAESSITWATLIQSAWALVVSTYGNTDEPTFGLTLSGRDASVTGISRMMGITIATVPVKVTVEKTSSISEYLHHVQQEMAEVKQHQHLGLQRISMLSPETRSAVAFQNLVVIQPDSEEEEYRDLVDMGLQLVKTEEHDTGDYALTTRCILDTRANRVRLDAYFDKAVISSEQVECLLHFFGHMAQQLATESEHRSLHDLDKMSPHDLDLLGERNSAIPPAIEQTLHGMFGERARQTPTAVAVDGFDGTMTYAELDRVSDMLADYMVQTTHLKTEARVLLSFRKSTLPIVSMLAILKAGGICSSTNPEHPTLRLVEMIEDIRPDVIMCDQDSLSRFESHAPHVIGVTREFLSELTTSPPGKERVRPVVVPSNGAFIVQTSGSTGRPKGSILEHRSLATGLVSVCREIRLDQRARTLQFSAYTFDCHILEIFGTLLHGGCVCVVSDDERMDCLADVMNERRVNTAVLTKTVSRLLDPETLPLLKTLVLTGEANGRQDYERWAKRVALFNGLGPSECNPLVCLTREPVSQDSDPLNIGHALGCHLWVTDHRRPDRLVPVGCVGELTVEGPYVGRGYINRPQQTAAAFIQDPLWSRDGSGRSRRFYRSGDLARMNPDGSISYIGRADGQVKIAGQRVELGEIEDQLRQCDAAFVTSVVEAVKVSARGGATALVVFYSETGRGRTESHEASHNTAVSVLPMDEQKEEMFREAQLKLGARLPRFMVPAIFLPISYLPYNASGKVERRRLASLFATIPSANLGQYYLDSKSEIAPPTSEPEEQLQELWAAVLQVPPTTIGREDNFFQLGGDSVLAMKLVANARLQGSSITVADVFRLPKLSDMATVLAMSGVPRHRQGHTTTTGALRPFALLEDKKVDRSSCIRESAQDCEVDGDMVEDMYPCTAMQEALVAVSSHRPEAYMYHIAMRLPPSTELGHFKSTWDTLVGANPIYRTRIVFRPGLGSLQVVLRSPIQWRTVTGVSLEQHLQQEPPLRVEYGSSLSRFTILHHGDDTFFVGTFHHALYDGWSLMRTYEEFSRIHKTGHATDTLPSYTRFIAHTCSSLHRDETDEFWRQQFPTVSERYPAVPPDHTPQPSRCKSRTIHLGGRKAAEATMATVIQAAWALLMARYAGSDDAVVGLTLSGRDVPVDGAADIIGPMVTTVPLRIGIDEDMTVGGLLGRVQRTVGDIRTHQHVGLQHLRQLSHEAGMAANFQNMLVVHTMGDAEITAPLTALGLQVLKSTAEESMDLALVAECTIRAANTLDVLIKFDGQVIPEAQIDFMIPQLEQLVSVLAAGDDLDKRLRDIELASPYDLSHLESWNTGLPDYRHETVHELVERQAKATPDAVAVMDASGACTYQALDAAADVLAAYLSSVGVGAEKHVLLSFRKTRWAIVSMLAVLKSGGACASVHFEDPLSRRLDILRHLDTVAVLTDSGQHKEYVGHTPCVAVIDADFFATQPPVSPSLINQGVKVSPSSAAFVIHTSGSTGRPKACMLEHHSVCLALHINSEKTYITSETRALQFAAYTWDIHVTEIFGTLISGGVICMPSEDDRVNNLEATIDRFKVNWLCQTPTVHQLLDPAKVPTIETIVSSGEPLTRKAVQLWSQTGRTRLINSYAPTETSNIGALNFAPEGTGPISVGKAVGCGIWVADRGNPDQLLPVGCPGEVLIEGYTVGRGYLNRPEANAAFIEDPKWRVRMAAGTAADKNKLPVPHRLYRTGDIGFFNPDGTLQITGRADSQVKIRGQRVELHEVEFQVYQKLPDKSELAVELVAIGAAKSLVSFVKLASFETESAQATIDDLKIEDIAALEDFRVAMEKLQQSLSETLPPYLIPSIWVPVSSIPKLTSGKTDRKRLRDYARTLPSSDLFSGGLRSARIPPRNDVEVNLRDIWSQIMGIAPEDISVTDSFLSLGGDSITAMKVVSQCRRTGIKLLVSTILERKTIEDIATHCVHTASPSTVVNTSTTDSSNVLAIRGDDDAQDHGKTEGNSSINMSRDMLAEFKLDIDLDLVEKVYPCTVVQEGMLLSQQQDSDSDIYQIDCIWQFKGEAFTGDQFPARVREAWEAVVKRHSTLRTMLVEHDHQAGHFIQVVLKAHPVSRFFPPSGSILIGDVADIATMALPDEDYGRTSFPCLALFRTSEGRFACRLRVSHAFVDGASLDILMSELVGFLVGKPPLAGRALDFEEYVKYEQLQLARPKYTTEYWINYLKSAEPCQIPITVGVGTKSEMVVFDRVRTCSRSTADLGSFCRRLGITQAAVIQAAWAIVLGAYTGQSDVCFGYLASDRDAPLEGIEDCVAPLISVQVCRVKLQDEGIANELLQTVHRDVVAGLGHRNSSLARLQRSLGLSTPLFNTCMSVQRSLDAPEQERLDSLIELVDGAEKTEFAINLSALIGPRDTEIGLSFQPSQISREYAQGIANCLGTVIESIIDNHGSEYIQDIGLVAAKDRELMDTWNSAVQLESSTTLHGLVEAQARDKPDAVAVAAGLEGDFTYSRLSSLAAQLAPMLASHGVAAEARVVLCFAKSAWAVVAMLGVLRAGGVCVPTTPEYPDTRLLDTCLDVEACLVLCDEGNSARFRGRVANCLVVEASLFTTGAPASDTSWVPPYIKPTSAAFVVYTSGGTGKPKGCVLEHHAVSKSQLVNASAMAMNSSTRVAQFAPYTLAASICEVFAPLVVGGCLCVISDDERVDDLAGAINRTEANWAMLTPTVAHLLTPDAVPGLRTLVYGGEPLSQDAIAIWHGRGIHLVNYWGPTECSNSGCLNNDIALDTDPSNIGRPSGCKVWITTQGNPQRLAPIGCVGELIVESTMLGREYLNRPEATEKAFLTDLAWAEPGATTTSTRRFYRTGDLGRWNPDGSISIAGRADNQVKIHGHRIELSEVQHHIAQELPSGSQVVVDHIDMGSGQLQNNKKKLLVAFIVLGGLQTSYDQDNASLEVRDPKQKDTFWAAVRNLEQTLSLRLPHYMIPSVYMPISKIPLAPSSKTDRRHLREFAGTLSNDFVFMRGQSASSLGKRQPASDIERELQSAWANVLGHEASNIGMDESFMALGGDSISAMQVTARCRKMGIRLPVSVILKKRTIAAMAPHASRLEGKHDGGPIASQQQHEKNFNLSPIQKLFFQHQGAGGSREWVRFNQSTFWRVKQAVAAPRLRAAFDAITTRHSMLRARFTCQPHGEWTQRTLPPQSGPDAYRFVAHSMTHLDLSAVQRHAEASQRCLNIVDGPVFSIDFFQFPDHDDGVIFLVAHHLVMDIVSQQVILRDLEDMLQGDALASESAMSFRDWGRVQERETVGKEKQLDEEEIYPLTTTPPPPSRIDYWQVASNTVEDVAHERFDLPLRISELLQGQSNTALGTSPSDLLVGPLALAFSRVFGDREVPAIFLEHHGRGPSSSADDGGMTEEPTQVVGWFTTMYPVHVPVHETMSAVQAVRLSKDRRRRVPLDGRPYFNYRHLTAEGAARFSQHDPIEILVNFTGASSQPGRGGGVIVQAEDRFDITDNISDAEPRAQRWAMIDVEVGFSPQGTMTFDFQINGQMAHIDRVRRWVRDYKDLLSEMAVQLANQAPTRTLSDFPLLQLSDHQLDRLLLTDLPKLGVDPLEDVDTILPLSGFQRFAIAGHWGDHAPRHWSYSYYDMPADADLTRLRATCLQLVKCIPLFRTLFVDHPSGGGVLQVVLRSLEPRVETYETTEPVDIVTERVFSNDAAELPRRLGVPFVRFVMVRTPTHTRLLLRCSHAQDDGFSRRLIVRTLANLYEGLPVPEAPTFAQYMDHVGRRHRRERSAEYWRALLAGSQLTNALVKAAELSRKPAAPIRVEATMPSLQKFGGATSATVFNAACAIFLGHFTGSDDIVFGRITAGRSGLDSSFQDLVGPCVNVIPVRVHLNQGAGPAAMSEVVQNIQLQYVESIPHETMGLDDIIRECTSWQKTTTSMASFPVITQHVNQEEGSEYGVGEAGTRVKGYLWESRDVDPYPRSLCLGAFPGRDGMRVSVAANSSYTDQATLETVLAGVCDTMKALMESANAVSV